jgi:hypothetical protein
MYMGRLELTLSCHWCFHFPVDRLSPIWFIGCSSRGWLLRLADPPTFGSPNFIRMRLRFLISRPGNCVSSEEYPGKIVLTILSMHHAGRRNIMDFFRSNSPLRVGLFILPRTTPVIEENTNCFCLDDGLRYHLDAGPRLRGKPISQTKPQYEKS